ncbi:MAG: hypothetical protein ACOYMF_05590 [Bacteroidales bacterium]
MKLTVAGKPVAIPIDAKINIVRSSPALNDDPGSYSYPFPVPTLPNQQNLGWPGRLQRVGEIADQSFILEDGGLQIFAGEVEYDQVTKNEIGVILKSGQTEFRSKMNGKKLADVDFGSEAWLPESYTTGQVTTKLAEWDTANTTNNDKYVVAPIAINDALPSTNLSEYANKINPDTGNLIYDTGGTRINLNLYMLQFRAYFMLEKIFESAGYTVLTDELKTSEFSGLVVFSRIINVTAGSVRFGIPGLEMTETLYYAKLMPDVTVIDFVNNIADLLCIMYDIDERRKEVRILFKKNIFISGNVDTLKLVELSGWVHREERVIGGFTLKYKSQDTELDTRTDYFPDRTVTVLPAATIEGEIVHITAEDNDYITIDNSDVLSWTEIGRLKEYKDGNGETSVELAVKIPKTVPHPDGYAVSKLELTPLNRSYNFGPITEIIVSLYHGRNEVNGALIPYIAGDRWVHGTDATFGFTTHLAPEYLYEKVYSEFLNWKAYRARGFTKYIQLTLPEVLSLRWDKKYVIGGIEIILDKISYELPHYGIVKIEGFTS